MEFRFSCIVHPSPYEGSDLHGNIPIRQHSQPIEEEIGTIRCQEDWSRHVKPLNEYRGGLAATASLMQVCVPECLPERLEAISYANELAFLYDDATENISQEQLERENTECQSVFGQYAAGAEVNRRSIGLKAVQAQVFAEMKAIDEPRAIEAVRAWMVFLGDAAGRRHHEIFNNLDDYIDYRLMDVGEMYWYGVVTFGMALTIPDHEQDLCRQLARTAYVSLGLQNDLYSWDKERKAADSSGQEHVINAIYVLMQQHQCKIDEARSRCRHLIKENVAAYEKTVAISKTDGSISRDLRVYLDALLYSLSGNVWWSEISPRYNPSLQFSQRQKDMLQHGWKKALEMQSMSRDETPDYNTESGSTLWWLFKRTNWISSCARQFWVGQA